MNLRRSADRSRLRSGDVRRPASPLDSFCCVQLRTRLSARPLRRSAIVALALLLVGCGGAGNSVEAGRGGPDEVFGEVATFEVVAGRPGRIAVGLSTTDLRVLAGGAVDFVITRANGDGDSVRAAARYLSVPGMPTVSSGPRLGRPSQGTGVYAADDVVVPAPGFWTIQVTLPGRMSKQRPEASFEVLAAPQVPTVGEDAPRTQNLTLASVGVQPQWLDSSASSEVPPDALLHSTVIAEAIAAKRPLVVVVSTPAYCTSRFCGPTTEAVRQLAARDEAAGRDLAYVHLEVWRDFDAHVVNKAAAEWVMSRGAQGREPWVFLVGSDGKIAARFDNVVPTDELTAAVDALR